MTRRLPGRAAEPTASSPSAGPRPASGGSEAEARFRSLADADGACAGCGLGIVINAIVRANLRLGLDPGELRVVRGQPCRASATARPAEPGGIELLARSAREEKPGPGLFFLLVEPCVASGGGAVLAAACRAHLDATIVVAVSWPPPEESRPAAIDAVAIALDAGALLVARETVANPLGLGRLLERGMKTRGPAVVEAVIACPEPGTSPAEDDAPRRILALRDRAIPRGMAAAGSASGNASRILTGVFADRSRRARS